MKIGTAAAAAALAIAATPGWAQAQERREPPETRVDEILVEGRPLAEAARAFVQEVGEAPRRRGLALWRDEVCVGVVNLKPEAAQPLIDHISQVAERLEVETGDPGCAPNVIIVFTEEPKSLATQLVSANRRMFRLGTNNFNLDIVALREFQNSDAPVRWWHTSVPTNSNTGERAVRLPGDLGPTGQPSAPVIVVFAASRLHSQIRDDMNRVVIVADVDRTAELSPRQLGDYLAFVALAQVDAKGDLSGWPSVLNVFEDPASSDGFSEWDWAFLTALYADNRPQRTNAAAVADVVADQLADVLTRDRAAEAERGD